MKELRITVPSGGVFEFHFKRNPHLYEKIAFNTYPDGGAIDTYLRSLTSFYVPCFPVGYQLNDVTIDPDNEVAYFIMRFKPKYYHISKPGTNIHLIVYTE